MKINPCAKRKAKILDYYLKEQCYCGKSKRSRRWTCLECKQLAENSETGIKLDKACHEHLKQGIKYVNYCKKLRKNKE